MGFVCTLCGGTEDETVSTSDRHGNPLKTVVCLECGLVSNDPIPTDEELARFYRADYRKSYKGSAEPRMRQIWRNFNGMQRHFNENADFYAGRRTAIDLGSGSGEFLFLARRFGLDCRGIEPNEGYAAYSRERLGLDVTTQLLEETSVEPGSMDMVRLAHVLEHMRDPVRSLTTLRQWMADDGLIYIEVPDIDRDAALKARGKIFHFGHIFNFNAWTLRQMAARAGLVEDERSASRFAGQTRGFFRKGPASSPTDARNAANAAKVAAALRRHNERLLPEPETGSALGRFFSVLKLRAGEMLAARRFSSPREVAEHFASRLRREGAG